MSEYVHREGTIGLAKALCASVARDPRQCAAVLAGLGACATFGPVAGLASAAAGATLLALRPRTERLDALGRDREEVARIERGYTMTIGHEWGTMRPVVLSSDDLRTHTLVLGTTGSAKTEFLLGLSEAAIAAGSGLLFVDGKGDVSLFAKAYQIARRLGRIDDLLVLNLMTGNGTDDGGHLLSNTLNPFAAGSSDTLTQVIVGLMDEVGGDGAVWKGRATAMFTGLMKALVWLRNRGRLELDVQAILDHMTLRAIVGLASGASYPDLPDEIRASLSSYLSSLPGYNPERGAAQSRTVLEQHGYLEMIFSKPLVAFADVYGHVFTRSGSQVDMADVVLNRRILVVMLPALEKAGDELANLGKIVVATLKGMMGQALGNRIEGSWEEVVDNRATDAPVPFLCILDEVGYYIVEGLALMAAQARSLGFAMVYAARDIPTMKRLNEKEAASIIANTNVKIFMGTDGYPEAPGKGDLIHRGSRSVSDSEFGDLWHRMTGKVETLDLGTFKAGDMLVLWRAQKVFARGVHPNGPVREVTPVGSRASRPSLRANYFVRLPPLADAKDL